MQKKRITIIFLLVLCGCCLYLTFLLFAPFLYPLLAAVVIAIVFHPAHARIQKLIGRPGLAALISTLLVVLIIVVPTILILAAVIREISGLIGLIDQKSAESGGLIPFVTKVAERPLGWLSQFIDVSSINFQDALRGRLEGVSKFLLTELGALVGNLSSFAFNSAIALVTLAFLFREGRSLARRLGALMPLSSEQVEKLFSGIESTIISTVYGGLVVAACQGALISLALWVFGVPSPILWGVVAAFFALLPVVGTAVVWVPAALYLLLNGHWVQALIMVGWGGGVVGTVDNLLRPFLIRGRVQMHSLLIFFAVLGGVSVFGFIGLILGPVIVAVTQTVLGMLREESREWTQSWSEDESSAEPAPSGASAE
jgi:predicted PurR-regulated permease PerM